MHGVHATRTIMQMSIRVWLRFQLLQCQLDNAALFTPASNVCAASRICHSGAHAEASLQAHRASPPAERCGGDLTIDLLRRYALKLQATQLHLGEAGSPGEHVLCSEFDEACQCETRAHHSTLQTCRYDRCAHFRLM